jgi:multiple sugar transport system ATP-binding protein
VAEIKLEKISKTYEKAPKPALAPLDLVIPDGQLAVLVGPSGCGKSTTLRIIAGLEEPSTGDVFIGDRNVTKVAPAERDIAMVFQSYALYPHMTVYDNLAFALRIRKIGQADIDRRVREAAKALGIDVFLDRLPRQLSGGQRQRVAIGRAVVRDPKVFLFDEPLSNLDAQLRAEMRREIARIHSRAGATAVYVTHDQIEAMTLADLIVVMKDGLVQQVGSPLEIYDAPRNLFVAGFLGTPAMNFLKGKLGGDNKVELPGFSVQLDHAPTPGHAEVVLGIRPQDISLSERPGATPLAARVEVREVMGSEAFLHLASDAGTLVVRTEAHAAPREGASLGVFVDTAKVHLFDQETGARR